MRKFLIAGLMAALAVPAVAMPTAADAQSWRDRDDRRDYRDNRRDNRRWENDRNHRWGRDDWRGWRNQNRSLYARGNWRAPFRYNTFRPGVRIERTYFAPRYYIADPWRYRLPPAGYSQRWVRHYDDVILVDTRRGVVIDVIRGFFF